MSDKQRVGAIPDITSPSDTLNCLFPSNTFLSRTYYYYRISELAKICLQNRHFEQQIHWVPLFLNKSLPMKRAKKRCDIKQQHSKQACKLVNKLREISCKQVERNYKILAYPVFINPGRPSIFKNALTYLVWDADHVILLCAKVFSPAEAILENEKTLGTRLRS